MKKLITLFLSVILIVCSFVGCSSNSNNGNNSEQSVTENDTKKIASVGETLTGHQFEVTLNEAEFCDVINYNTNDDNFFTPFIGTPEAGKDKAIRVSKDKDMKWLYFDLTISYTGKTSYSYMDLSFIPCVKFKDYSFSDNYMTFMRINGEEWFNHSTDFLQSELEALGLSFGYYTTLTLEPLSNDIYNIRGAIFVPNTAIDDTSSDIMLDFETLSNGDEEGDYFVYSVR